MTLTSCFMIAFEMEKVNTPELCPTCGTVQLNASIGENKGRS